MKLCALRKVIVHQNAMKICFVVHSRGIDNYLASDDPLDDPLDNFISKSYAMGTFTMRLSYEANK